MTREKRISEIKRCIGAKEYSRGESLAREAISEMHRSAVFYNLLGVLLEKEHHHVQAIRYFKTAYELNPEYGPARYNLERYGMFCPLKNCMYSDEEETETGYTQLF